MIVHNTFSSPSASSTVLVNMKIKQNHLPEKKKEKKRCERPKFSSELSPKYAKSLNALFNQIQKLTLKTSTKFKFDTAYYSASSEALKYLTAYVT